MKIVERVPEYIRSLIAYEPGKPIEPTLKDFLLYILSRQGQEAVAEDGGYLPLNADEIRAERAKLE